MKSPRVNDRYLLNQTFSSSQQIMSPLKKHSFSIKKQLYRGIKDNDVNKIIEITGSRQNQEDFQYNEEMHIHNILTSKRKHYDKYKTETTIRKKEIQSLKKQLQQCSQIEKSLKQTVSKSKMQLSLVLSDFQTSKTTYQQILYKKDIYISISQKLQEVFLVQKKKLYDLQVQLQKLRLKHKSFTIQAFNKKKLEQQCRKMVTSIQKVVSIQKRKRQKRLFSMREVVQKKQNTIKKIKERQQQIQYLMQKATNQKSYQQKEWIKVFLSNKFLHIILKNKILNELQQHQIVQKSFQRIKLETGVIKADEFVEKYLMKQQKYGELLNQISQKETLLRKQQSLNSKLTTQMKQIQFLQEAQFNLFSKFSTIDIFSLKYKEYQKLSTKSNVYQRLRESFYQWAIKFIKKYENLTKQDINNKLNCSQIYPRKQILVLFQKVEFLISNILQNQNILSPIVQQQDTRDKLFQNTLSTSLQSDTILKNTRVRTQQFQYQDFKQTQESSIIQNQYLRQHRRCIKRDERNKQFRIKTKAI